MNIDNRRDDDVVSLISVNFSTGVYVVVHNLDKVSRWGDNTKAKHVKGFNRN